MVGVWPSPLVYTKLLKQFCSFWRYFNLPGCHSYLVRKFCEQKKGFFYFVLLSCTTLGQWTAWIPCCFPFQPTAGFPRRPLPGFDREILIGGAAAPLTSAGAVTIASCFYLLIISNGVKRENRLLWFFVTLGCSSPIFSLSAICKHALEKSFLY